MAAKHLSEDDGSESAAQERRYASSRRSASSPRPQQSTPAARQRQAADWAERSPAQAFEQSAGGSRRVAKQANQAARRTNSSANRRVSSSEASSRADSRESTRESTTRTNSRSASRAVNRTDQRTANRTDQRAASQFTSRSSRDLGASGRWQKIRSLSVSGAADQRETNKRNGGRKLTRQALLMRLVAGNIVVVIVLVALYVAIPKLQELYKPEEIVTGIEVEIYVPTGASTRDIARILRDKGVITDQSAFINTCRTLGVTDSLKPGTYRIITGMSLEELAWLLVSGPADDSYRLTIPEGFTIYETATRVEQVCNIPASEFLIEANDAKKYFVDFPFLQGCYNNTLEGFLYPKTYQIPYGANAEHVVRVLLRQFQIETQGIDFAYASERGLSTYDVIVMASLIERETFVADERAIIASVIYNRLRDGMLLQIDATIIYAIGDPNRDYGANPLLYSDLDINNPYNTYRNSGLPPGPICSPQVSSIIAASQPAATNYYYYVLTSQSGTHTFCATVQEFEEAQAEYRRVFGLE